MVGHYRIVGEIGRGGMGVVYRALDVNLEREVALKCPRPDVAPDAKLLRRFLHEARTVSRLPHPNIIPVYEVFEDTGHPWLASELVEGEDLRAALSRRGPLPAEEVLAHAEGLTDALAAAHAKGILHRDIKPSNVLIGTDGRARLADFGIAGAIASGSEDATTRSASLTGDGHVVGTPGYMSPEQVLGKPLDDRSDIFSLGAVLYEMCTGRPAFGVTGQGDWVDALLHREPQAISRFNYDVPEELERIVRKSIAKRADERYQHASEMLVDVRAIRRRIESGSQSGEKPRPVPRRSRTWLLVGALTCVVALLAPLGVGEIRKLLRQDHPPAPGTPRQLTGGPACEQNPVLSPDGSLVAYVSDESGTPEVFIMDVRGGTPLQRTRGQAVDGKPAWFPDGSAIAFTGHRDGKPAIFKIPKLGGSPVLIVLDAAYPAIAPDGDRIAFSRRDASGRLRIAVAPLSDPSRFQILTHDGDGIFLHANPAWSPDGTTLCYEDFKDIWTVPSAGGSARPLTLDHASSTDCAWSPSGSRIYHSSLRQGTAALWWIPVRGGDPVRLTMGVGTEVQPSVARDGARLAHSTAVAQPDITLFDTQSGDQLRLPGFREDGSPALAPDGSAVVWVSARDGKLDLWLQPLSGVHPAGPPRRLTDHPGDGLSAPSFSRDGKWIAYYRVLEGQRDIWVIPVSGGPPTRFTDDPATDLHPSWSPDGASLVFSSDRDGRPHLWVQPIANGRSNGPARRLTSGATFDYSPAWSPDGGRIAFVGQTPVESEVWVIEAAGASPPRRVTRGAWAQCGRWLPSGTEILVSGEWDRGRIEARRVSLADGRSTPLQPGFSFGSGTPSGEFDVSHDGRVLAFVQVDTRGDLWVLEAPPGNY